MNISNAKKKPQPWFPVIAGAPLFLLRCARANPSVAHKSHSQSEQITHFRGRDKVPNL